MIADAKRGDIGSTSRAYAAAYLEPRGDEPPLADALTVNPYLGRDALEPFLAACRRDGARALLPRQDVERRRRRRAGPDALGRDAALAARGAARRASGARTSSASAASRHRRRRRRDASRARWRGAAAAAAVRSCCCPASARRAATPADLARAFTSGPASALVTVSRSVIYAYREREDDWRGAAGAEAARLAHEVWAASGW